MKTITIAGASGFWGDAARSTPQLLGEAKLDYIVYDYLAEITMSIMARARAKDPGKGYALDFVKVAMGENLPEIARQGVKVISNAGGVNPQACAEALRQLIAEQNLDLKVACVLGDDLFEDIEDLSNRGLREMFSDAAFPDKHRVQSVNAYLGAFPIARALDLGADIVITGRGVDSAVTLGACIHSFAWQRHELDQLAMGSLAGHILECGPQATGGNFTDWHLLADSIDMIGYPYVEVQADGKFVCTKPAETGGLVSIGTVAEQLLYEIGDPQSYILPDVCCDFSAVQMTQVGDNRVSVEGARGGAAPATYKVCATIRDGYRGGSTLSFYGIGADQKATALAEAIFRGSRRIFKQQAMQDFSQTSVELMGAESQYGKFSRMSGSREVVMKIAAKHPDATGIAIMLREMVALGLAAPPGLSGFQGARPKPSPVVRLFSFELPKSAVSIKIEFDGQTHEVIDAMGFDQGSVDQAGIDAAAVRPIVPVVEPAVSEAPMMTVPLVRLAWGRSGDKGNKANIGIIARREKYFPFIISALSEAAVAERFEHFFDLQGDLPRGASGRVERFLLPGINAINFLLHDVLGGGGMASIRNDAQGKGYAQLLLEMPISIPEQWRASL